jgi:error-prone DNA polymerase
VELRASSAFSFLSAASQPEELAETAAAQGYRAVALADAGGVYGIPRFVKAARAAGVRPIVGARVRIDGSEVRGLRSEVMGPRTSDLRPQTSDVLLLCENEAGWQNLCELLTEAHRGQAKGEHLATRDMVERFREGLVCLAGGEDGPILAAARQGGPDAARDAAARLAAAMGQGRLCLDLQRHGEAAEEHGNRLLRDVAASLRLPLVATNDVRYDTPDKARVFDVLAAIREHVPLDGLGNKAPENHRRHLVAPAEMARRFADDARVVAATAELADRLAFSLATTGYSFPRYPAPHGETEFSLLHDLVHRGVRERYRPVTSRVMRQVAHELSLIEKLDLAGYFLLVWDIGRFCREEGILAQGRGSAANSVVCYALGLTAIDPIAYELLFERFLSEERGEWPDIDLDLPSGDEREKAIQYVYRRYGERSVGMTAAVITYQGKSAAREVGKALGLPPDRIDRLSHTVGYWEFRHTKAIDEAPWLAERVRDAGLDPRDPRVAHFIDVWERIRDLPRHISQHNGGLVICGGRLDRVVPIEPAAMEGRAVVQWDKDDLADLRLIKVDLLGLGMLAALRGTIDLVARHEGVEVDLAHLPPDDPPTYEALRRADTVGVFQVESRAQMATLPRMKPTRFYDLVVEVAIIRPGPIVGKMVSPYLERRAGRQPVVYAHPSLEPILSRTLGVPLFQEQLMRVAMAVAGFTGGQAEELRRAMGSRRSRAKMQRMAEQLHEGMTRSGIPADAQEQIVKSIEGFALYGFPESHAASFALIAYASAYLKVHHPAAFCCALLNAWPMGFYHPATLIEDVARHGVEVLPVDVIESGWECELQVRGQRSEVGSPGSPSDPVVRLIPDLQAEGPSVEPRLQTSDLRPQTSLSIRLGLRYVKGLSRNTADRIVAERAARPFEGVTDLGRRAGATSAELFTLAEVGALAALGRERRDAMWQALALGQSRDLLHGAVRETPDPSLPPMLPAEQMVADFTGTGMTTGPHPFAFLRRDLARRGVTRACDLASLPNGRRVKVAGMVLVRQRPGTAKGIYFATLEDETGFANIVVMPVVFAANRSLLSTATFIMAEGRLQSRDGVTSVRAERMSEVRAPFEHRSRDFC